MRKVTGSLAALAVAALMQPAQAQPPMPAVTLKPAEQAALVEQIGRRLEQEYHDPALVPGAMQALRQALKKAALPADGEALAAELTRLLQPALKDAHARVVFGPEAPEGPDDKEEGPLPVALFRHLNCGVERVEHYPGNIGYLRLDGMAPVDACAPTVAAALQVLAQSDAVILDLRRNGGGSPEMVQWLASHFLPPGTPLSGMVSARDKTNDTMQTLAGLQGPQLPSVPLYLLTSQRTFSAAEHLAYDLQQARRARVVGEASGGGANPGAFRPVHANFRLWLSKARSVSPVTGGNWEGRGVQPDEVAEAAAARRQAFALALKDLEARNAPTAMPGERAELLGELDRVVAKLAL